MKSALLFLCMFTSTLSFSQLIDGALMDENRKLITEATFKIIDHNVGVIYYELAVNRKGIVTSAKLLTEGTTIVSTPTRVKARNYAMTLKFAEGTYYPEFHHVRVKISVAKE